MQRRVWIVVGLFAGIAIMLGAWMALSTEPSTARPSATSPPKRPKLAKIDRPIDIGPDRMREAVMHRQLGELRGVAPPPGKPPGVPTPTGDVFPLDEQGVKAAVAERMKDLQGCYETALFHTPDLAGKMVLELTIEPVEGQEFGHVSAVATDSDIDAAVFEGCVATVFEELKFAATEPTTLRYPVEFSSDE